MERIEPVSAGVLSPARSYSEPLFPDLARERNDAIVKIVRSDYRLEPQSFRELDLGTALRRLGGETRTR